MGWDAWAQVAEESGARARHRWWHWPLGIAAVVAGIVALVLIGMWAESIRARIWIAEMRKAGVTVPAEAR